MHWQEFRLLIVIRNGCSRSSSYSVLSGRLNKKRKKQNQKEMSEKEEEGKWGESLGAQEQQFETVVHDCRT